MKIKKRRKFSLLLLIICRTAKVYESTEGKATLLCMSLKNTDWYKSVMLSDFNNFNAQRLLVIRWEESFRDNHDRKFYQQRTGPSADLNIIN